MSKSITKADIREIITEVIAIQTGQFKREFNNIYKILVQHDRRFDDLEEKLYSGLDSLRNGMIQFEDKVMGSIKEMKDEIAVLVGYKDDIEDHGVRIEKLEQKVFPSKN